MQQLQLHALTILRKKRKRSKLTESRKGQLSVRSFLLHFIAKQEFEELGIDVSNIIGPGANVSPKKNSESETESENESEEEESEGEESEEGSENSFELIPRDMPGSFVANRQSKETENEYSSV